MKIVIVNKTNSNQKTFLTATGEWDHRISKAKDFEIKHAREKLKELSKINDFVEIQAY